jgi:hypothetical protein
MTLALGSFYGVGKIIGATKGADSYKRKENGNEK